MRSVTSDTVEFRDVVPFTLTFVEYEQGDTVGWTMALLSLAPVFAMVGYATLVLTQRDVRTLAAAIGQVSNELLSRMLKDLAAQDRPARPAHHACPHYDSSGGGHGMPSSHAQFAGFFAAYWTSHVLSSSSGRRIRWLDDAVLLAGAVAVGIGTCASRLYLGYHTPTQVLVGLALGLVLGRLWEIVVVRRWLVPRLLPVLLASSVGQALRLRDPTCEDPSPDASTSRKTQ